MSFDEFLYWLDRLVEDGEITAAEAEVLAAQYDEFLDLELPIAPEDVETEFPDLGVLVVALLLYALYNIIGREVSRVNLSATISRLTYAQRVASFGAVQDAFQAEVTSLAGDLASGAVTVSQWQQQFNQAIAVHYRTAAQLAYGSAALSAEAESALRVEILRQQAFLSRFADSYTLSVLRGEPYEQAYIANRSRMYAGSLRASSYRIAEMSFGGSTGWVVYYIAVDDERTCSQCTEAMLSGPYLMGAGPMPGEVCLGRSACRCRRELVFDPDAYRNISR